MLRKILAIFNDTAKALLLLSLLVLGGIFIFFFGASVWANMDENKVDTGLPKMPTTGKAEYTVITETTGDVLLTPRFDVEKSPNDNTKQLYTLYGFYRVENDKWRYVEANFQMDEYYWGEITVEKRR